MHCYGVEDKLYIYGFIFTFITDLFSMFPVVVSTSSRLSTETSRLLPRTRLKNISSGCMRERKKNPKFKKNAGRWQRENCVGVATILWILIQIIFVI